MIDGAGLVGWEGKWREERVRRKEEEEGQKKTDPPVVASGTVFAYFQDSTKWSGQSFSSMLKDDLSLHGDRLSTRQLRS